MPERVYTLEAVHAELEHLATQMLPGNRPRYLFRGERDLHQTTYSSIDRLYHSEELPETVHDELDNVTAFCMKIPLGKLHAKLAGAFAQHYGLPTQIFDFTASPRAAINFAANRLQHMRPWPRFGIMGILDVSRAEVSDRVELFDLRHFGAAKRAVRQAAFGLIYSGFVLDDHVDLKRSELASQIGLEWRLFAHLPDDEAYLLVTGNDLDLESIEGDQGAAIPEDMIEAFVASRGPLCLAAASILARTVPHVNRKREENVALWTGSSKERNFA